ncbi:MAG: Asp23/Gls24 family envelope stress response protein [Anaerolineaceae bacterium]|jgi:uncharacterized alkaline shock family protein YloU|nr:Asp23/Gls24 family envelope stress response protein [Anaerolineaceae bacterium]OQY87398.1 MAG: hypothetical protein B6D38_12600 [Anaerolineae bacterium UTCFX1]
MSDSSSLDKTTISPDALLTIVKLSALGTPGVSRMANVVGGVNRLFRRGTHNGVRLYVEDNIASADLHLVLKEGADIRETSRNAQAQVARALQELVGMEVGSIEVHVEDIDYNGEAQSQ